MLRRPGEQARWGTWLEHEPWRAWTAAAALGVAVGCIYFLAARLGLALLTEAEGVAVFWPASGVAAGAVIVLERRAAACVAVGVVGATVAANLMGYRSLAAAVAFGLCNAGEAALAGWLTHRWAGRRFKLDTLRGLWGFLAAAAVASGAAAIVATVAMRWLHAPASPFDIWRVWAAADGLGIVTIAPLLIGLHHLPSERTPRHEAIEGMVALALLAATSAALYIAPAGWQLAPAPPAVLFPLLLWIAARCRPVFAAAAAFVISAMLVGSTTFHLGPFAAKTISVPSVQATMLVASLCALTLAALFAERRRSEAALMESNERLQLALGGAQLGVWGVDLATDSFESDARDSAVNGHAPAAPPRTLTEARRFVHPEDLPRLDAAFAAARHTGAPCRAEYRVRVGASPDPAHVRWVAVEGNVVRDAAGRPVRLLGVTRDITEPKLAEAQKDLLLAELDHRVKNALAVVTALLSRTRGTSGSVAELVAALDGRIKSMATTHELLSVRKWQGIALAELIERELEPYATESNVAADGPDVMLKAEAGQALAMVVHELATNAAKYGALSVERGRVSVRWSRSAENGSGPLLALDWLETGGPTVAPSSRVGYGTSVIRDLIPYELGGSVDLMFAPTGVHCRMRIPAKWLCTGTEAPSPAPGEARATSPLGRAAAHTHPNGLRKLG